MPLALRRLRPVHVLRLLLCLALAAVVLPATGLLSPAAAEEEPEEPATRVTLMGTLMSELGCEVDWDEACTATDLTETATPGRWQLVAAVPAGAWEWKVRLDGSWDRAHPADNLRFRLARPARLRFTYDEATDAVAVEPADRGRPTSRADAALARNSLRRDLTREQFYFVMADRFENGNPRNDRGGLGTNRLKSGYDPTATGFFHGGDLAGLIKRLDYIEGLGTTAIWLTPSFKNKPVQGAPGSESAGYHGYWITDFTKIDPHLGTNADMKRLVALAHRRGIKVFFDVITNHTADVIDYDRSSYNAGGTLPYRSTTAEPYTDAAGEEFDDRDFADGSPAFPAVDPATSFPYAPVVPPAEASVKVPSWLNDPRYYHNRGTSTFAGESNTYGDFPSGPYSALDDLWTEHPRVVKGMIDIYRTWVRDVGIDGFRIDTVKHVNTEFWQQFSPALTGYAAQKGNDDFFMFGEVYDANPEFVSQYTTEGRLQAAVDFGFQASATSFAKGGSAAALRDFYASDDWYTDRDSNAYQLPTFLGNHDMGRIGSFLRDNDRGWSETELLRRDRFAHALMYLTRGQPVVYYGDEQGFSAPKGVAGGPGDQRAREDMFASRTPLYNGYDLIGSNDTTRRSNFRTDRPLYRAIAQLSRLRKAHPALADGAQVTRYASAAPGIFAFSRLHAARGSREYVVALNNATITRKAKLPTFSPSTTYQQIWPRPARPNLGALRSNRNGKITVQVAGLSGKVYRAVTPVRDDRRRPTPSFTAPAGTGIHGRAEIGLRVPGTDFTQVTVAWRPVGATRWNVVGTDDNAPYRVFHDVRGVPVGTMLEYRAVAKDAAGRIGATQTWAAVVEPPDTSLPDNDGPVTEPAAVSVPGSFNSELGCSEDWQPPCAAIDLAYDAVDEVWSRTYPAGTLPAGGYAYKAALNDTWDENYGANAQRNGANIELEADGGPVTFYYSRRSNWVTSSIETPDIYTAVGSFQSEMECPADWSPDCLRSWLQDPDGDGVWSFRTRRIPPGSYTAKTTLDQTFDTSWGDGGASPGADIGFTVGEGEGVSFRFDEATKVLSISTYPVTG